jgi:hypothetical protein
VVWTLVPLVDDEFTRVEIGYLGAATLLCSLLYTIYRRPRARPADRIKPGSAEEVEVQLASGDEAG